MPVSSLQEGDVNLGSPKSYGVLPAPPPMLEGLQEDWRRSGISRVPRRIGRFGVDLEIEIVCSNE